MGPITCIAPALMTCPSLCVKRIDNSQMGPVEKVYPAFARGGTRNALDGTQKDGIAPFTLRTLSGVPGLHHLSSNSLTLRLLALDFDDLQNRIGPTVWNAFSIRADDCNGITYLDGCAARKQRLHSNAGTVRLQPHHCPIIFASMDEDPTTADRRARVRARPL